MALPKPSNGIILIEKAKEKNDSVVVLYDSPKGRLLTGKVVDVGKAHITESGATLTVDCKPGQTAWFLSYEGNYDLARIDGKDYYFVLFRDLRGYR